MSASFIHDDFLLGTPVARELFHGTAATRPIFDYHCHLPPADIAGNRRFANLFEAWLEGDHYKWRAMRANGVAEKFCTGDAAPYEKFLAYARTVPQTLRNPLHHWTHLELKRYFGIDELLSEKTAPAIWERANAQLASLTVHAIFKKFRVAVVCTTDDPTDTLEPHRRIAGSGLATKVYPAFRPDKALQVDAPAAFNTWTARLEAASNTDCAGFGGFLAALKQRHDHFHAHGGRLSDHGLNRALANFCDEREAAAIYDQARRGTAATPVQHERFASFLMLYFGQLDAARGWTKQLHLGALRNTNTRLRRQLGADVGCDSIGDFPQAEALGRYLDRLDADGCLPKMVLYNVNPNDNYLLATMAGNFQDGSVPGKIQFGGGWWFLDQLEGMEWQLNALSNIGLLSRFVGMLTDSRSFLSYPRHEYFRRLLCDLLGRDVARGLVPDDREALAKLVRDISYDNAAAYFGLPPGAV